MCSQYRESTPDTWKAEGEPLTQHVTVSDQPWRDCIDTLASGVTYVNSPSQSELHLFLTNTAFTEDNRTHCQAERAHPQPLWKILEKQALCSSLWELWQDWYITWMKSRNIRGSNSSICPLSLVKRFKIVPARTGYEKLLICSIGTLRETIHEQIKTIFLKHMYLDTSLMVQCLQCRGHVFNPWSRKTPHAAEQLSLCATTTEAHVPRAWALQQKKWPQCEAQALQWGVTLACCN